MSHSFSHNLKLDTTTLGQVQSEKIIACDESRFQMTKAMADMLDDSNINLLGDGPPKKEENPVAQAPISSPISSRSGSATD